MEMSSSGKELCTEVKVVYPELFSRSCAIKLEEESAVLRENLTFG